MTIECTNIESVLKPMRGFGQLDYQILSLRSSQRLLPVGRSLAEFQAWAGLQWHSTLKPPVSQWLGNPKSGAVQNSFIGDANVVTFLAFLDQIPVIADGHPWSLLSHQAGGTGCEHLRFVGKRLEIQPSFVQKFLLIADHWYGKEIGQNEQRLSTLIEYQGQLQKLGLDCNQKNSYSNLTEAFYPLDVSQEVIDRICVHPFPLESVLGGPCPHGGIEHYASLLFIAPNSD